MRSPVVPLIAACLIAACAPGLPLSSQEQKQHPARKTTVQSAPAKPAVQPPVFAEAVRENYIGMALMERHQFSDALANFQRACVLNPQSDVGCLNTGIALLNMKDFDDASRYLKKSSELEPQNPRPWFNLGLLERETRNVDAAKDDFLKVAAVDPDDADTHYFLGYLAAEAQQYDKAAAEFSRAIELNPFHASAEYGLAQAEEHLGDADTWKTHLAQFRHITQTGLGRPVRFLYGEQGKYSLAEEMTAPPRSAPAAIPVHFVDVTATSGLPHQTPTTGVSRIRANPAASNPPSLAQFLGSGACILDYDGDGLPDIFLVNADGKGRAGLYRNTGKGHFEDVTKAAKLDFVGDGTGCAVGDYDNDGHPDLAVGSSNGVTLFHNQGDGTFADVTDQAGVRTGGLVLGLTFVDYDGDGDLDLYVTRFDDFPLKHPGQPFMFPYDVAPAGNVLWRNQGNDTFVDSTSQLGLAGSAPSVGAIIADVTNNGLTDLALTGWSKLPGLLLNPREGAFQPTSPWAISMPGPTAGVVAADFNRDGWTDLAFTHWAPPGLSLWRNVAGKSFERVSLVGPGWMRGWGVASLDYDNDGWGDLVAVGENFAGEGRIILLRNEGRAGFRNVTQETGLDKIVLHQPRSVVAFDFDGDGATDLLITQNGLPPVLLKNAGGSKNNSLQIA
ncbi:MAG TPA: FG-GAP-like repeat-containing protein, partial [Candidatus Bathyarchaeia archaeon]|nr:FG-GAP-like repeat-containing protein [Candidatus Bathyarchaeia archaeon]